MKETHLARQELGWRVLQHAADMPLIDAGLRGWLAGRESPETGPESRTHLSPFHHEQSIVHRCDLASMPIPASLFLETNSRQNSHQTKAAASNEAGNLHPGSLASGARTGT